MRILIAEDDTIIADGLSRSLRQGGYAVDWAPNGVEADTALVTVSYDLLILDLGLPKMSGLEVLKRLRARNSQLPVLILTALDGTGDRVKGLDLGADDYMIKPFELAELEARVRALTRRSAGTTPTIQCGALTYDQVGRVAQIQGQPLDLSAQPVGFLSALGLPPLRLLLPQVFDLYHITFPINSLFWPPNLLGVFYVLRYDDLRNEHRHRNPFTNFQII